MKILDVDQFWMRRALRLAKKECGKTHPNPAVGCVIAMGDRLLGLGYHRGPYTPHAEQAALTDAGTTSLHGATCYVTMEPCNHWGRTPPCTASLIKSGIRRVVIGCPDPNPSVLGGGISVLRDSGMEVIVGVLQLEAERLIEFWKTWVTLKRPFIILKMGISIDGKVATSINQTRWITGPESLQDVHRIRHRVDGIMVGSGTINSDNPSLTARKGDQTISCPVRIVADSQLTVSVESQIFTKSNSGHSIIGVLEGVTGQKRMQLEAAGVEIVELPPGFGGVDLKRFMSYLGEKGIESILLEGGPRLAFSMLHEQLIDKVMFYQAPILIGGKDAPSAIGGDGFPHLETVPRLHHQRIKKFGNDILIEGYLNTIP